MGKEGSAAPPLVHLSDILDTISPSDSSKLKEELLVATSNSLPTEASGDM